MSSKPSESQELKLAPGWTSLSKTALPRPPTPPPRIAYSKSQLLDLYDPHSTAVPPSTMSEYPGLTSVEPLVPVNISHDDHTVQPSTPTEPPDALAQRSRFQPATSPVRPGVEAILGRESTQPSLRLAVASSPPAAESGGIAPTPGSKKPGHASASARDFWSGSAVLAAAERPNAGAAVNTTPAGTGNSERRPLHLKPRSSSSVTAEPAPSPNGHSLERSAQSQPYWSRGAPRGGADSKSNWRGGGGSSSIASGGAKYPGASNEELSSGLSGPAAANGGTGQTNSARKSTSDLTGPGNLPQGAANSSGRSAFGRDGGLFGRNNKEALKPTNTRDLSALAKGSSRDPVSSTNAGYSERDHREHRHQNSSAAHSKVQTDGADDTQRIWFYRDPQGNTQGPFTGAQLIQWEKDGYYDAELPVSKSVDRGFKPLAIAFGMRKDDSGPAAPPPGFINNGALAKKEEKVLSPSNSMRPSREERNRRGTRTVEDMAEEVEMMRLQARNKRISEEESAPKSGSVELDKEKSVFDESQTDDKIGNGCRLGAEKLDDESEEKPTPNMLKQHTQTESVESISSAPLHTAPSAQNTMKPDPPVKQSRFAALMRQDAPKVEKIPLSHGAQTDHRNGVSDASSASSATRVAPQVPVGSGGSVRLDGSVSAPMDNADSNGLRDESATPFTAMIREMQQKEQQQLQRPATADSSQGMLTSSDQDLMAIDPAIAHASFARPSLPQSPPLPSPHTGAAELPPWLHNTTGVESLSRSGMQDGAHMASQSLQTGSAHRAPLVSQLSRNQAQLHAQAQARAQAEAQARAEALRQAQVRAQVQAQVQAQRQLQAQAQEAQARAAAQQHASALAQAQAQAQSQVQPHTQDPVWVLTHRLGQFQAQYELTCRSYHEMNRTAQAAQAALNSSPAGSHENQRARSVLAQARTALAEHHVQMERIKTMAQTIQARILQHQAAASHEQQHRHMQAHPTHLSPARQESESPQPVDNVTGRSPTHSVGNGITSGGLLRNVIEDEMSPPLDARVHAVQELNDAERVPATRDSAPTHDRIAVNAGPSWETVTRKSKHGPRDVSESETLSLDEVPTSARTSRALRAPIHLEKDDIEHFDSPARTVPHGHADAEFQSSNDLDPLFGGESVPRGGFEDSPRSPTTRFESAPTIAPWSKAVATPMTSSGMSLREIQRQEELRVKSEEESTAISEQQAREEVAKAAAPRWGAGQPWGGAGESAKQQTLSLREIEEEQKKKQKAQTVHEPAVAKQSTSLAPVARPLGTKTGWASLVAKGGNNAPQRRPAATVIGKKVEEDAPFWETVGSQATFNAGQPSRPTRPSVVRTGQTGTPVKNKIASQSSHALPKSSAPIASGPRKPASQDAKSSDAEGREGGPSDDNAVIGGRISAEFAVWCTENLQKLTGNKSQDTTMFEYLVMLGSSSEIRDTILQNMGSNDKTRSFADEFIRRLEFERTSIGTGGASGKKKSRRQRAAKVDPSLVLGFTSTSSRIMQGTIETPEMK